MRTTKQATAQSVTVSRMRCGSMGDCSELSEEEDAEVEEEERTGLFLHIRPVQSEWLNSLEGGHPSFQ